MYEFKHLWTTWSGKKANSFPLTQRKGPRFQYDTPLEVFLTCGWSDTFILVRIKDNLLVAQIFRHGDDLRSIKKFILIILITHVSFARAALICKEKSLV